MMVSRVHRLISPRRRALSSSFIDDDVAIALANLSKKAIALK